jgi:hypothetical protein
MSHDLTNSQKSLIAAGVEILVRDAMVHVYTFYKHCKLKNIDARLMTSGIKYAMLREDSIGPEISNILHRHFNDELTEADRNSLIFKKLVYISSINSNVVCKMYKETASEILNRVLGNNKIEKSESDSEEKSESESECECECEFCIDFLRISSISNIDKFCVECPFMQGSLGALSKMMMKV